MIRRGPEIALLREYNVRFKDSPYFVSRKLHLDLGEPREYEESNETVYKVETNLLGPGSTLYLRFLGGNKLESVDIIMPMDDPNEIKDKFNEITQLIESVYKNDPRFSKDDIINTDENEYSIHMFYQDSSATGVSYKIYATRTGLTLYCSYIW